jgi:hypothetical protein
VYAEKAKVPVYGHLRFKSFQDLKTYFFRLAVLRAVQAQNRKQKKPGRC